MIFDISETKMAKLLNGANTISIKKNNIDKGNNILYDILIYAEWAQEPEVIGKVGNKSDEENHRNFWGWLPPFSLSQSIPSIVQKFMNMQMPWKLTVASEGKVIAIVQDDVIEIRSSREEYGSVIGKCTVPRDPYPQWRKALWSPDCSMLALSSSNGNIAFIDLLGNILFNIPMGKPDTPSIIDGGDYIADMVFIESRTKNTQWSSELIVVTFKGKLRSFLVSPTEGFKVNHSFSFNRHYPRGITGLATHKSHNVLIVSGIGQSSTIAIENQTAARGFAYGMSLYRLLSDYPHYKIITTVEDEKVFNKKSILHRILPFMMKTSDENFVLKMSISPNGQVLAAVHASGSLSLWALPSLRLQRIWDLSDQENHDAVNPHLCEPGYKKKIHLMANDSFRSVIADLNWWSDESLIIARFSGAVTILSTVNLQNLLGLSPEWYEPAPQVSVAQDRGFLGVECEQLVSRKKRLSVVGNLKLEDLSEDEEETIFIKRAGQALKTALYYLTDSDRFQPPKKKTKFLTKTYRLLSLKSTTPEELFTRKLDNEEYGEALALAKVYKLDCDLVYQRQWRKCPVSVASIQDYLSKITKRVWVLHECLERVPENIDAARELLLYGLKGTELETLIAIGKKEDEGRFMASKSDNAFNYEAENFNDIEEDDEDENDDLNVERKKKLERFLTLIKSVDFKNLTLEQKQLCQSRQRLLAYLDRLNIYETILGGGAPAEENYNHIFFRDFRSQTGFECCVKYAQNGDWKAVTELFSHMSSDTLKHWLPIISNFPETLSPVEYRALLPEAGFRPDEPDVYPWDDIREREKDWVETYCEKAIDFDEFEQDFYEENTTLQVYRTEHLNSEILTNWYIQRALDIERMSFLVDNALELVKCGREKNVKGLEKLHDALMTLETLIYECHQTVTFDEFESMKDIDKVKLLMASCNKENLVRNVRQWLIPFLTRLEKHAVNSKITLMREYLISLAKKNIMLCQLFIEASKPDNPEPLVKDVDLLITLALDCVYSCEQEDMLSSCCAILDCMPDRGTSGVSKIVEELHLRLDELEKHLTVANVFNKYGVPQTPANIKNCQKNPEEIKKMLISLTAAARRDKSAFNTQQWKELIKSITHMQQKVFMALGIDDCFEIIIQTLLYSEQKSNIDFARQLMETSSKPYHFSDRRLPYKKSVKLVQLAAEKYFNLAASLSDPSIFLAKNCLNLIENGEPCIEEELDLILSLTLLQDFNVNIIPLQVRLCKKRIDLIKQALKSFPTAYKNSQKLLRLATLIRVCGKDSKKREGEVLTLVAEKSLLENDFTVCVQACQQLIERCYEESWSICYKLGSFNQFTDIPARVQLLGFALIYCSDDLIEEILSAKRDLELQELSAEIKKTVEQKRPFDETLHTGENESDLVMLRLKQTADQTLQVLHATSETTKAVLATVSSQHFWKDAVKWIQPSQLRWDSEDDDNENHNNDMKKIGVHSFYCRDENSHVSTLSASYTKYVLPDLPKHLKTCQEIMRAAMIESSTEDASAEPLSSSLLLDIAQNIMSEDAALSLGYLLAVKQPSEVSTFFSTLPKTAAVFEFASYYFCLSFFTEVFPFMKDVSISMLCKEDSEGILKKCNELLKDLNVEYLSEEALACKENFLNYRQELANVIESELLERIHRKTGISIDTEEFLINENYRKEIILQLAILSEEVFSMTKSLAQKYNISLLEFHLARLTHLIGDSSLTVEDIETEIKDHKMVSFFRIDNETFNIKMQTEVLPIINGMDHKRVIMCFSLMTKCGDLPDSSGHKPSYHIKLLNKIKSFSQDVNYCKLMSPNTSSEFLALALSESNVINFAKTATKIPLSLNSFHSASSVYCIWGSKLFIDLVKKRTRSEWIRHYDECQNIISKLTTEDFVQFINSIIFSEKAVLQVPEDSRVEILRKALKYCQQNKVSATKKQSSEWELASIEIQKNLDHLNKLDDELVTSMKSSSNPDIQRYIIKFDMTRSIPEKIEEMIIEAVVECVSVPVLQDLLSLAPFELALDVEEAYRKTIYILVGCLSHSEKKMPVFLRNYEPLSTLERILDSLIYESEVLSEEIILEILNPFLSDNEAPTDSRLQVLKYLEQKFMLNPEDTKFLLLCKSQALLEPLWTGLKVKEENLENITTLMKLYTELFIGTLTAKQLFALANWLLSWPSLPEQKSSDPTDNIWIPLLKKLIEKAGNQDNLGNVIQLLEQIFASTKFSLQCHRVLYEELANHGTTCDMLKLAVLSNQSELFEAVNELLRHLHLLCQTRDFDDQVLAWIVNHQLTVNFVTTPLYIHISNYLCKNESKAVCEEVIRELEIAGLKEEAAILQCRLKRESQSNSSSITSAFSALRHWLPGKK